MSQIVGKFIANGAVDLTTKVTGTLPTANGGTGMAVTGVSFALTDGATPALDASKGYVFTLTSTTNPTIAVPSNPTNYQKITIIFTASGGSRTLALNSGAGGFSFGSDITGLTATPSGTTDYIGCQYNPTSSKWHVIAYAKGFT